MSNARRDVDVAVVGGGLAGLAAAVVAARAGRRVTLFERAAATGGRARTLRQVGFHWNVGPHAIYTRGAAARELARLGVTLDGARVSVGGALALHAGTAHALPVRPAALLTTGLLGASGKLHLARLLAALARLDTAALRSLSVDEWLADAGLPADARALLRALVRLATYADAPQRQSAGDALRNLQLGHAGTLYLHGGWQALVDALAAQALAAGARLDTRAPVVTLVRETNGSVGGLRLADGTCVSARTAVVSASPAETARLLDGADDTPLPRWAATREPVRAACLDVALRRLPCPRSTFALGIDRPTYLSVHSAVARLAPDGAALVHVARYLGARPADDTAAVKRELEGVLDLVQPGWRDEVVRRRFLPDLVVTHALTTAAEGGTAGRPGPQVPGAPGLYLAGDWVGAEGLLVDASLASAVAAARQASAACSGAQLVTTAA